MAEQKKTTGRSSGSSNKSTARSGSRSAGSSRAKSSRGAKNKEELEKLAAKKRLRDEIWSIVLIALGAFLVVSLQTEAAGQFGHAIQLMLKGCFGFVAYILPYYLILYGILLFTKHMTHIGTRSAVCLLLVFLMVTIVNSGHFLTDAGTEKITFGFFKEVFDSGTTLESGGVFGMFVGLLLVKAVGKMGLYIFSLLVIAVCGMLVINTPISQFLDGWKEKRLAALARREEEDAAAEALGMDGPSSGISGRGPAAASAKEPETVRRQAPPAAPVRSGGTGGSFFGGLGLFGSKPSDTGRNLPPNLSPGQRKILDYMQDDSLFDGAETRGTGLGLEDPVIPTPGMGLWESRPEGVIPEKTGLPPEEPPYAAASSAGAGGIDPGAGAADAAYAASSHQDAGHRVEERFDIPEDGPESRIAELIDQEDGDESEFNWNAPVELPEEPGLRLVKPEDPGSFRSSASQLDPAEEGSGSGSSESDSWGRNNEEHTLLQFPSRQRETAVPAGDTESGGERRESFAGPAHSGKKDDAPIPELKIVSSGKPLAAYKMPPVDLLNKVTSEKDIGEQVALQAKAMKLEETLHNFGVNAKVIQVTKGPAVTRYEIQPNTGVKVSSIVRLSDDIALNLEAKSIRMEAPIPGKAAVGIEVENDRVNMVSIREIVDSAEFKAAKSKISFAVGKDIAGNAIVADLKGMPHLLIAGSTGSGKSVCINSLIISILYKARPDEVKLVLIDPKVVELSNYNGIPHLLIPVVTDPSKAAAALNWAVAEMDDRYNKFAEERVRDLASYNDAIRAKGGDEPTLPQVVIIIDELADLMMSAPSQVEESICRLAQKARAAGMHLIVATQRPSVDIITGVIKANIPSRIAFAVSSQFDSRTILDMAGAEKLVGKGDMLFHPMGMGKPLRVQGCFISDSEVHKVIEYLKDNGPETEYSSEVINSIDKAQSGSGGSGVDDDEDELLAEAIETAVQTEKISVSMLQRRFRIGYNRAARLVDMMEARGIIGPADGSRPRKVLMSMEELEALNAGADVADPAESASGRIDREDSPERDG